jgi:hypothetical protein
MTRYPDTTEQAPVPVVGATVSGEWRTRLELSDLDWYLTNRPQLRNYTDLWIAISRRRVVASGDSIDDVFNQVDALSIVDPFVVFVKPFPTTSRRIA